MSFVESFRSSSPARQIGAVATAVVVLGAVLITAYFLVVRKPYGVLFTNLRSMDAATIVAELDKKKIPYRLDDGGTTIRVPTNLVDSTRLDVATEDLPIKGTVGFELFNKSDMGLTEFAQQINYQRALQGELARTIITMAPVESARVHLVFSEPTVFRDDRRPSKAAVTLLARPGKEISAQTVQGIQRLVAAAVPDLTAGDVVVLGEDGRVLSGEPPAVVTVSSPDAQQRRAIEEFYDGRVREALAKVMPTGVTVDVIARADLMAPGSEGTDLALESWSPTTRSFPLTVKIAFATPLSADLQDQVRRLAADAVGLDAAKGDLLMLAVGGSTAANDVASAAQNASATGTARDQPAAPAAGAPSGPAGSLLAWVIPVLALLIGAAAFLQWRFGAVRRLSEGQRRDLAERLQAVLEKEGLNANSAA